MNHIIVFIIFLAAHAVVTFLAFYAADTEESPKEQELCEILKAPILADLRPLCGDFAALQERVGEMLTADRYFVLRSSLAKLRDPNYILLVSLLPSVVFLWRAQYALGAVGFPGGVPLRVAVTVVMFVGAYLAVAQVYKITLKLPQFDTEATDQAVMLADHYRYLLRFEATIRRRNMMKKLFAVVYFLFFWNPSGYYE